MATNGVKKKRAREGLHHRVWVDEREAETLRKYKAATTTSLDAVWAFARALRDEGALVDSDGRPNGKIRICLMTSTGNEAVYSVHIRLIPELQVERVP